MMGSAAASCSCLSPGVAPAVASAAEFGRGRSVRSERKGKLHLVRCVKNDGGDTRRSDPQCQGDAVLRNHQTPESSLPQSEKKWDGMSGGGMAFLLTSSLGYTVCESVQAAVEAVPESADNPNLMFIIACIAEALALTGAVVGGVLARQRKDELEKINTQLRQINVNLRRQSRVESYAPNLTYAPVGSGRLVDTQVREDPVRERLMTHLKAGKRFLREQNPGAAFKEFEIALPLAQKLKDTVEEKKAARGLGASCQRQGKYREAIKYHTMVLNISHMTRENSGDTEAYGAIADCYTELGDLETAGKFYDRYIGRLEQDD
ncbi:hypothetical protein R1sor_017284 [Riccia sorocarpa]|uniref:Protein FLUORESCENT IN BLUE LIGHT, chloroplastic n=1 Tax=Riccia sorocarpa TaxID=122646 RepID=A0ABD3I963_9MARC